MSTLADNGLDATLGGIAVPASRPAAKTRAGGLRDFFRYHGLWAPGVRLFRKIAFRGKATIIAFTFLVPMAVLGWNYFNGQQGQIDFSAKERLGVAYAKELMALLPLLEQQRIQAGGGARVGAADRRPAIESQLAKLASAEAALGAELGTAKAYAAFVAAQRTASTTGGADADAASKAWTASIQALLDLLGASTDGSNLTLDPDIDTYYLMDTAMFRLPAMVESAGRIRGDGIGALESRSVAPAPLRRIVEQLVQLTGGVSAIDAGIAKAAAYNAEVGSAVKVDAMRAAIGDLAAKLDATVLHAGGAAAGSASLHAQLSDRATEAMLKLAADATAELDRLIAVRVGRLESARNTTAVVMLIGLLMALYLFMSFRKVLDGGLREVAFHIDAMRNGDLTTSPRAWGADEAASLMNTLVQMQESLRHIVTQVRLASDTIVLASSEIAGGANDLSTRTEQSASNLQQTASAMQDLAHTVKRNEESASTAARLAEANAVAAENGGRIIEDVVSTMHEINGSSERIGEITSAIEGISFQTHLLAINAAVEAARAGQHGRGFAVVASDVRALAHRSSKAAREIRELIGSSTRQVTGGVRVVRKAGETIGEMVVASKQMRELLADVAHNANRQADGVGQTTNAVQEIDSVTQQNAALVEQTAAAATSLKEQAHALAAEVARFRLPETA